MLDHDGELPYVVWYQCKSCTHLFYDDKAKIFKHLRDHHGPGAAKHSNQVNQPKSNSVSSFIKSNPLPKLKERPPIPEFVTTTTSSGTDDCEDNSIEESILNNNNNNNDYAKNLAHPRKKMRYFLNNNNNTSYSNNNISSSNSPTPLAHGINLSANSTKGYKAGVPTIEDLKRQLLKSDIDISEIKIKPYEDEEIEEEDEELEEGIEDPHQDQGVHEEFYSESFEEENEENSEYQEEGASTSNQSFYDSDLGGHFLFKNDNESESFDDNGSITTPSFSMIDELLRSAEMASSSGITSSTKKRAYYNPCKLCKRNFPSLSSLKKHAKTHLNEDGGSQHVCKFCFDYFPSAAGLSKHLLVHSEENPNVCQVCSKSFTSWATLRTHLKIHSGERNFGCDECGQRFQTKSTLDSHLRIHTGARPHVCPICEKSFRTSSPLYRHMRSVHKGINVSVLDS